MEQGVRDTVLAKLQALDICGGASTPCSQFQVCQLQPAGKSLDDPAYQECLHAADADIETATGYCYIDGLTDRNQDGVVNCTPECYAADSEDCDCIGDPRWIAGCVPAQRRRLRFVSPPASEFPVPWPTAELFVDCTVTPFRTD